MVKGREVMRWWWGSDEDGFTMALAIQGMGRRWEQGPLIKTDQSNVCGGIMMTVT